MKKIIGISTILLFLLSCGDDDNSNACNTNMEQIMETAFLSNGWTFQGDWMDLETHEYTVRINTNTTVCSVGYRNPSTYSGSYTMEVINQTSGNFYSGTHSFSQTTIDFQAITPLTIQSGDIIVVKRTIQPGYTLLNQTIGDVYRQQGLSYPVTNGNFEFLGSNAYGAGGPVTNFIQPEIILGLQ